MAVRSPRRRNGKIYMVATLVVLALLWVGYWYGAREIASVALERMTTSAGARGYTVECQDEIAGGFPLGISLSCNRVSLAAKTSGQSTIVDGFSATAPLYRPGRIESVATGPLVLGGPANAIGLTANWLKAETTLGAGLGGLSSIATYVEDLSVRPLPGHRSPPFGGLAITNGTVLIAPGSGDSYRISASALDVAFATDDGRQLPEINLEAELSALAFGDSLGLDPREALRDWLSSGAILQIDNLAVAVDTVSTRYSGTLALSPDGGISGDLKLIITGLEALPDVVDAFRPGSRDKVAQVAGVIAAFSKPVKTPAGNSREMTILIRDNIVSIGIIPIGVIPRLSF